MTTKHTPIRSNRDLFPNCREALRLERMHAEALAMYEALRRLVSEREEDQIVTASDREALASAARAILARIDGNPKEA